jgi:integrase
MRLAEALGLCWKDVDLEDGVFTIRRTLRQCRDEAVFKGYPKSGSERHQAFLPQTLDALRSSRFEQKEDRLAAGSGYRDFDLIVCWPDGRPWSLTSFSQRFKRHVKKLGLGEFKFKDLRATALTQYDDQGTSAATLQRIAGHHSASFTLEHYVRPDLQSLRAAAARYGAYLREKGVA